MSLLINNARITIATITSPNIIIKLAPVVANPIITKTVRIITIVIKVNRIIIANPFYEFKLLH